MDQMSKPGSWMIHLAAGGELGLIKGVLVSEYGSGGAGFVERYGRDDVVGGFERGRPDMGRSI